MPHVAVIGAGITGITTAFQLFNRGFDVTVIDRQRYAAMETSFANGGQLSASNAEVWNTWSTVFKGIKWMAQRNAPLLVNPTPTWHKISWMAEFLANIPNYSSNTIQTAKLAIAARGAFDRMAGQAGVAFDGSPVGILHIYETARDLAHAKRVTGLLAQAGLDRRAVSPAEIANLAPMMRGDFLGGYYTQSDSTGDIHKYTTGLADYLKRQGVQFLMDRQVQAVRHGPNGVRIETDQSTVAADAMVVCAGVGSRGLARQLGDRVNIYPVKGYSITVHLNGPISQSGAPEVSLLDDAAKVVTSRLGKDRFRVAGTAEFNGENRDIRADRIAPLVDWVERYFPDVSTEHVTPWAGLRPMMPNMMPKVGRGRSDRVFYNTGHGHLGWTLSAATAELIGAQVQDRFTPKVQKLVGFAAAPV